MIHVRTLPGAVLDDQDVTVTGRTVTVRVVSWDTPYRVTDDGRTHYREQFATGGLALPADGRRVLARLEHDPTEMRGQARTGAARSPGVVVGRVISARSERDGLYADVQITQTGDGDDALALINDDIVTAVSAEFDDDAADIVDGALITRSNAELVGIAFTLHPQHGDARILAVRSEHHPAQEETTMPNDTTPETSGTDTHPATSDDMSVAPAQVHVPEPVLTHRSAPVPGAPEAAQPRPSHYRSFGQFAQAAARGELGDEQRDRYFRALGATDTDDATGLINVQWVGDVIDIYRTMTPTVQAFEQATLPENGLVISQPIVGTRPTVDLQSAQNAEIESTVATITTASWNVVTFAGGANVSLQTILRTDPAYLDALMRLYVRELALDVNTKVAAALVAAADDVNTTSLEYTTAAAFDDLIIDASAVFMDTLHRPAELVGLSVDLWKALAKADGSDGHPLYPAINPQNRSGSMNAVDSRGQIRKVDWYVDPAIGGVGAGVSAVIGVRDVFKTFLGPVGTLTADVPTNLGRDVAVYQFGAYGKVDAAGLYRVIDAA